MTCLLCPTCRFPDSQLDDRHDGTCKERRAADVFKFAKADDARDELLEYDENMCCAENGKGDNLGDSEEIDAQAATYERMDSETNYLLSALHFIFTGLTAPVVLNYL